MFFLSGETCLLERKSGTGHLDSTRPRAAVLQGCQSLSAGSLLFLRSLVHAKAHGQTSLPVPPGFFFTSALQMRNILFFSKHFWLRPQAALRTSASSAVNHLASQS
jgi:hypothetical protein